MASKRVHRFHDVRVMIEGQAGLEPAILVAQSVLLTGRIRHLAITGGCLCGAVRYAIDAEPAATRSCWCRTCQYLGAGNATVNVFFPSEAIAVTGALKVYRSEADSGGVVRHEFCPVCGTPVFTQSETRTHVKGVRAGTLDAPERAKPQKILWVSAAPSWAPFDPAVPRVARQ
jgi:hypothetical protein